MHISSARHLSLVVPDTQTEKQFVLLAVQLAVKKYREEHPTPKQGDMAFSQGESALGGITPEQVDMP